MIPKRIPNGIPLVFISLNLPFNDLFSLSSHMLYVLPSTYGVLLLGVFASTFCVVSTPPIPFLNRLLFHLVALYLVVLLCFKFIHVVY